MSRRAALGTALGTGVGIVAAGAVAHVVGVDDDALQALGVHPHPEPDPADARLLRRARRTQAELVGRLQTARQEDPDLDERLLEAAQVQLTQLGGGTPVTVDIADGSVAATAEAFSTASRRSAADALRASDLDLTRVLASLSAGRAQIARVLAARA